MGSVVAAVIAVFGAVCLGYITNFIADDYRRFRDGSTLAAGLAGELGSYETALPMLAAALKSFITAIDAGKRAELKFRGIERPADLIYESNVEKLGLLGAATVESVVFVYGNIRAFRIVFEMIHTSHTDMSDPELRVRCESALAALERAMQRGGPLLADLRTRAAEVFRPMWPWDWSGSKRKA